VATPYRGEARRQPEILALDFDGVLCEGTREYFETSRRTYRRVWPGAPVPGDDLFPRFRALRPVIETGWEMPVLIKALVDGVPAATIEGAWTATRDAALGPAGPGRATLSARLRTTLDEVRRDWIAADRSGWLEHHELYAPPDAVRRLAGQPAQTVIVTTKEGEFARALLDHWGIEVAGVEGKEAGHHKCDNLRQLLADRTAAHGGEPGLWFVEDRLETLLHVTTHPDLERVGLFLATWGYNTPRVRAAAAAEPRIRLLALEQFTRGLAAW
jgi:hypothetical protein